MLGVGVAPTTAATGVHSLRRPEGSGASCQATLLWRFLRRCATFAASVTLRPPNVEAARLFAFITRQRVQQRNSSTPVAPLAGGKQLGNTFAYAIGVSLAVAAIGCNRDITFAPRCAQAAPRLAGTWSGAIAQQAITLQLIEECQFIAIGFQGWTWVVGGEWSWGGLSGTASSWPYQDPVPTVSLTSLSADQGPTLVVLTLSGTSLPAISALTGTLSGEWRSGADPVTIHGPFDGASISLIRR